MLVIAFLGHLQHEVAQTQILHLLKDVKQQASCEEVVVFLNAGGLFLRAPRLAFQLDTLFESGISYVFPGSGALPRNSARQAMQDKMAFLVKPENCQKSVSGSGLRFVCLNDDGLNCYLLSLAQSTNFCPMEPPVIVLDNFFRNKSDSFPVIINVCGSDLKEKKALFERYRQCDSPLLWYNTGVGYQSSCMQSVSGGFFQADIGEIANCDTVDGVSAEDWLDKRLFKQHLVATPVCGPLRADYTLVWFDKNGKTKDYLQKTVSL